MTESKSKIILHLEDIKKIQQNTPFIGNVFNKELKYQDIQFLLTLEGLRKFLLEKEITPTFEISPELYDEVKVQLYKKES